MSTMRKHNKRTALNIERDGKVLSWTWEEYYQSAKTFAKAVISTGATQRSGIAIMGYNSPEWIFTFTGGLMANSLVTGIYITNEPEACMYQINHSESEIVVVETATHLARIRANLDKMP